jgi:RNA polymerase sigma-70 factor (ECF subfamily)
LFKTNIISYPVAHIKDYLWSRIKANDPVAFEQFYQSSFQQLSNYCFKLVRDEEIVKDILQDIYTALYLRRSELPDDLNIMGYLTNAIKFKAAHIIRHQLVKNSYSQQLASFSLQASENTEKLVDYNELNNRLGKSLADLPEKCRTAFILNKLEQYPYKEVSKKMGISVKTVEKHISRALKQLRTELSDARSIFPFW